MLLMWLIFDWVLLLTGAVAFIFGCGYLVTRIIEHQERCPDCGTLPGTMHDRTCPIPEIVGYWGVWTGEYDGVR